MNDKSIDKRERNMVSIIFGAGLILLGILFLIGRFVESFFHFDLGHYAWPFYIILPGVFLFLISFALERKAGLSVAMLGGMVTTSGAILLVQNTFDLYASWAYAWALVAPTSAGLAMLVYGGLRGMSEQVKRGLNLTVVGLAIFVIAGFFFEMVIGLNGFHFAGAWLCWPAMLIGLGIILLGSSLLPRRKQASE